MAFILKSKDFNENGSIPSQFTCDGENMSPELNWQGEPANTVSFVLIMDDPDAPRGNWDHWLVFNIPAAIHELSQNCGLLPKGAEGGKNSWGKTTYGGPCPPDREHRYYFKLYALNTTLTLSHPDKSQLESAMQGHILANATLMARYDRQK